MNRERYLCLIHWAEGTAGKKENIVSLKQNSADSYCGDIYIMSARLFIRLSGSAFASGPSPGPLLFDSHCLEENS